MSVAKLLYQLQETDQEIEATTRQLAHIAAQLGNREAVLKVQARLEAEQQRRARLQKQQQAAEWEIDDLSAKLKEGNKSLFSGRIMNPKELSNLQQEMELLKNNRARLEEKTLGLMEEAEGAEATCASIEKELSTAQADWQTQQTQLAAEQDRLKTALAEMKIRRQATAGEVSATAVELYESLRRTKAPAVVKVEQGICRGCRISLPASEMQRVRSGDLVRCGSCGRILFLS